MSIEGKLLKRTEEVWSERPENRERTLPKEPRWIVVIIKWLVLNSRGQVKQLEGDKLAIGFVEFQLS